MAGIQGSLISAQRPQRKGLLESNNIKTSLCFSEVIIEVEVQYGNMLIRIDIEALQQLTAHKERINGKIH